MARRRATARGTCVPGIPEDIDDNDPCTEDGCDEPTGTVFHLQKVDGEPCAQDPCVSADSCVDGECVAGGAVVTEDGNPCTIDVCDSETGEIAHYPQPDGMPCGANLCEGSSVCENGECVVGPAPDIADGNPCTIDACDPATGEVSHELVAAGTSCADANACDGAETCDATGVCVAGQALEIDDAEPCTLDRCEAITGQVIHEPLDDGTPCSDDLCNSPAFCAKGVCTPKQPEVPEETPCRIAVCDPATGEWSVDILPDGTPCPDGDPCNGDEFCYESGWCYSGPPLDLDDGNPCTVDSCDPSVGVQHLPEPEGTLCTPGDACYSLGTCDAVGNCSGYELQEIDDGNPCTIDLCNAKTGEVTHEPDTWAPCPDENVCDGEEYCDDTGTCIPGYPLPIDDGNPCTFDACDPAEGVRHELLPSGSSCSDGDACNGIEICDGAGTCQQGQAPQLSDNNPCTQDECDPAVGVTHVPLAQGASCSEGNACNGEELCDGAGNCLAASSTTPVDDGNPCTNDSCDASTGVVHVAYPAGVSCSDGNACNGFETCDGAGHCQAGAPPVLDDGDPCTEDICLPSEGVEHRPVSDESCSLSTYAWTVDPIGRPSPRDGAAIAYDPSGDAVLIVGGENAGVALGDTWRLELGAYRWSRFFDTLPPRTAAALSPGPGGTFVLFGGMSHARQGDTILGDTWVLDPGSRQWVVASPSTTPPARAHAVAAFDEPRSRVLLIGGHDELGGSLSDVWAWDGTSWSEVVTQNPPSGRSHAAAAVDTHRGVLVVAGGGQSDGQGLVDALDTCWELDLTSDSWTACPQDLPVPSLGHAMAFDETRGRMVLTGGTGNEPGVHTDTWEYDGTAWSSGSGANPAPERVGHALAYDTSGGTVRLFGGTRYSDSGLVTPAFDDGWSYQADAGWQARGETIAPALVGPSMAFDSDRGQLVTFGVDYYPWEWRYDGTKDKWTSRGPLPTRERREGLFYDPVTHTVSRLRTGYRPVFGPDPAEPVEVRRFDGTGWSARDCSNAPHILDFGFALDADRGVLLAFGGRSMEPLWDWAAGLSNALWELDLATCAWDQVAAAGSPSARVRPMVAFDSKRDVLVVFGGNGSTPWLEDTWEFDGTAWSQRNAPGDPSPGPRSGSTMVYDSARDRVVLFGGEDPSDVLLDDTWEYDGASGTWEQRGSGSSGPRARRNVGMVYDSVTGRTVMLGGTVDEGRQVADMWFWDGDRWHPLGTHASPEARSGAKAVSLATGSVILFGGVSGDGQRRFLADTWKWEDGTWGVYDPGTLALWTSWLNTRQIEGSAPRGRVGHAMASDGTVAVVFGGEGDSGLLEDLWFWADGVWSEPRTYLHDVPRRTESAFASVGPKQFVLFGGRGEDESVLRDTWRLDVHTSQNRAYDSATWHLSSDHVDPTGPPARYGHAMVQDPNTGKVLLFGGRDAQGKVLEDTWVYDPPEDPEEPGWQQLSPALAPPARFGHQLTADATRGTIVLTGGVGGDADSIHDDLWEWSFATGTWSKRNPGTKLRACAGHAAFFDLEQDQLLAFGGLRYSDEGAAVSTFGDTWSLANASSADTSPARFANGYACTDSALCESGHCVDGVCCNSACDRQCEACSELGHEGSCVTVSGNPRGPRTPCGADDPCVGTCNGVVADRCLPVPVGASCAQDTCIDGSIYTNAQCSAEHVCEKQVASCDGFACDDALSCYTSCWGNEQCDSNHLCKTAGYWPGLGYLPDSVCVACQWPCAFVESLQVMPCTFTEIGLPSVPMGSNVSLMAEGGSRQQLPSGETLLYRFTVGPVGQTGTQPCGDFATADTCAFDVGPPGRYWALVEVRYSASGEEVDDARDIAFEVEP